MTASRRILGIDPGMATVGFGCIEADPEQETVRLVDCGVIVTPAGLGIPERLHMVFEDLHQVIQQVRPDQAVIEKLFFYRMGNTIQVAQARGVILLVLAQHHLNPTEFTPAQIKQSLTGYGQADKRAVQEAVARELQLSYLPKPDDAADGLAIALTGWYRRFDD